MRRNLWLAALVFTACAWIAQADEPPAHVATVAKLDGLVRAQFENVPLRDVLATICKAIDVKLEIDESTLRQEGVEGTTPVTMNFTKPISARSALDLVLRPKGLGYTVCEGLIKVHREADIDVYRKEYYLERLVKNEDQAKEVLAAVARALRESKVKSSDELARTVSLRGTRLIADQPQEAHELIADTLFLLREQFRKKLEDEQLSERRKEAARWNAAAFRPAGEYSATDISAHMEAPLEEGRNRVYCASFQLAWSELVRILGAAPRLRGDPPLNRLLNSSPIPRDVVSPHHCLVMSGPCTEETIAAIKAAIKNKFPDAKLPAPRVDTAADFIVYAHLLKQLAIAQDFERLQDGLKFKADKRATSVRAFGVKEYEDAMWDGIGEQVTVLDYRDGSDFIIKLHPSGDRDEIVLAKVAPQSSLAKTVEAVLKRMELESEKTTRKKLGDGESIAIPQLALKTRQDYSELVDIPFMAGRTSGMITQATQLISFRLNEQGAILESSAELEELLGIELEPPPIRHFIFDQPFLVLLRETGARQPYMALWIANTELMEELPVTRPRDQ
jgi:hypothetical protein